jgi:hypothetical protein
VTSAAEMCTSPLLLLMLRVTTTVSPAEKSMVQTRAVPI